MRARLALLAFAALTLTAATGAPQSSPAKSGSKKAAAAKEEAAKPAAGPNKDPEGKRGISPYMEHLAKGEAAFIARDMAGAVSAFQDAIKLDTERMIGFYRLGEAQAAAGKPEEAEAAWQAALPKKGTEDLNAKLLFVLADLKERLKNWQGTKDAWGAYTAFLQSHPKALGYPATAIERQKQADRRIKDEAEYGVVKERIAKRLAEKEAEAMENAKKDKLNR